MNDQVPADGAKTPPSAKLWLCSSRADTPTGTAGDPSCSEAPAVRSQPMPPLISLPDAAISKRLRDQIGMVLERLTPREAEVVRMRFGIGEMQDYPPDEIAKRLALSRQHVFSIQTEALRKLRRPGRSVHLKPVIRA